jgi:asparagine synthase (glutamine-hydrolysing)
VSGIVGILNVDGAPVDRELLERMTAFQSFRGPDRQDLWIDGPIGFGHTLARTTDESERERQPCSLGGRLWITADARVDAREDLRGKLRGHTTADLEEATDPELILHAYDAWGEECFQQLLGDFSFALWDASRRRLVCAVDHFGVKPFYYARVGNAFVFSNTLDCVRMHPLVRDDLNEVAIGDFLLFGHYQDRDITVYADIPRIPPAHFLVVERGDVRRTRYWTLPEVPELRLKREEEYVERFQELLDKAVADRLRTNRAGVFMSGGLDSPLVAATAKRVLERKYPEFEIEAFTVVYDRLISDDEAYFAALVARSVGIKINFQSGDEFEVYDWLIRSDWLPPEPIHDPTWGLGTRLTNELASTFSVALTGWDGDAILKGTVSLHWLERIREGSWLRLARDVAWYIATQHGLPPIGFRARLRRLGVGQRKAPFPSWLNKDFATRVQLADRWAKYTKRQAETSARSASRVNLDSPLWTPLFDAHDSSWSGIVLDVGHPFVDARVVAYALSLRMVPWCVGKELLRRCLKDLPVEVRSRPKTPLRGDPVLARVREQGTSILNRRSLENELLRFVNGAAVPVLNPSSDVDLFWSDLRPISLDVWLKGRGRRRTHVEEKGVEPRLAAG